MNVCFFSHSRDRCRTVVNVLGDAIGAGIVAKFARNELNRLDELERNRQQQAENNGTAAAPGEPGWNMTQM